MSVLKYSERLLPSLEYRKAHTRSPSVAATVIMIGCCTPWPRPTDSTKPTIRSTAATGSSRRPKVRARWNITSESVEPAMDG
jgi:hypothetical protein